MGNKKSYVNTCIPWYDDAFFLGDYAVVQHNWHRQYHIDPYCNLEFLFYVAISTAFRLMGKIHAPLLKAWLLRVHVRKIFRVGTSPAIA